MYRQKQEQAHNKWQELSSAVYRAFSWKRLAAASVLTLAIHGAIYEAAPETLSFLTRTIVPAKPVKVLPKELLEEIPEDLLPEEFRRKPQFVPVNPEAPAATPKDESHFSAANQRAAQENPVPESRERIPTNDGELEDSRAVSDVAIPRELLPPELRNPPAEPNPPVAVPAPPREGESAKKQGVDVPTVAAGTLSKGETPAKKGEQGDDSVPEPAPRPQILPPPGLKSITMRSNTAVNEIGTCSLDAKYSEFGDYTQRMLEAIQAAWNIAVQRSAIVQPRAVVVIEFTLNSDGTVDNVRVVFSDASKPATHACLDAVSSRAPFDPWRADMVAFIGKNSETSRISFYYR
ncbi:MAG: hypothetical protein IKM45_03450 [Opitutales bacterium]|nr:hypothetical protein [Opitutales bacterium]